MKIKNLETIYKIFDAGDKNYSEWYGTAEDIIEYLKEQRYGIPNYNADDGFIKNLERYGLTFTIINK